MAFLYYYVALVILCDTLMYFFMLYRIRQNAPIDFAAFFDFEEEWVMDGNIALFDYNHGFFHFIDGDEVYEFVEGEHHETYIGGRLAVVYGPRRSCRPRS